MNKKNYNESALTFTQNYDFDLDNELLKYKKTDKEKVDEEEKILTKGKRFMNIVVPFRNKYFLKRKENGFVKFIEKASGLRKKYLCDHYEGLVRLEQVALSYIYDNYPDNLFQYGENYKGMRKKIAALQKIMTYQFYNPLLKAVYNWINNAVAIRKENLAKIYEGSLIIEMILSDFVHRIYAIEFLDALGDYEKPLKRKSIIHSPWDYIKCLNQEEETLKMCKDNYMKRKFLEKIKLKSNHKVKESEKSNGSEGRIKERYLNYYWKQRCPLKFYLRKLQRLSKMENQMMFEY